MSDLSLATALRGLGHSQAEIDRMSPQEKLDEWIYWHGFEGWSRAFIEGGPQAILQACEESQAPSTATRR